MALKPTDSSMARVNAVNDIRREMEDDLVNSSPVYAQQVKQISELYGERTDGRDGLGQKERILIGVATAVCSGTQSAVEWTITRAVNHGASEAEIRDALDVALFNGGSLSVSNFRYAHEALRVRLVDVRGSH